MKKLALLVFAGSLFAFGPSAYAADHLATATAAGGLLAGTSQPFLNGFNNPAPTDEFVPGQGSPLSGEDTTTPATDTTNSGVVKTPKPVLDGKTAPSANSKIP